MTKHFTLFTSKGSTTFSTELEWDEALALCSKNTSDFAQSLVAQSKDNRKTLSPKQISWVYKFAEDVRSQSKKPVEAQVFVSNILSSMARARANGLKKPKVKLVGPNDTKVKIVYMATGTNAGGCWVNLSSPTMVGYVLGGKITPSGEFLVINNEVCAKQDLIKYFTTVDNNFEIAVKDYGFITSSCSICGLTLTDPKSIERGIGPVCAEKYGMGL